MKPKVQILMTCPHCDGAAYLPDREAVSATGEPYMHHSPCAFCQGFGTQKVWIELEDLIDMLVVVANRDPMEPDWRELARQQPISQTQESREAAGLW